MRIKLRNRKQLRNIVLISLVLLIMAGVMAGSADRVWHTVNYALLDHFYRWAVDKGYGPQPAFFPGICYLHITDHTYDYFGKNYLDRQDLAPLNTALKELGAEGVIYDIIFARPSEAAADALFARSLSAAGNVHLPVAFALADAPTPFQWQPGIAHTRIQSDYSAHPRETRQAVARPFHAVRAVTQYDLFAANAAGAGHITAQADTDGIYRHLTLLVKIDQHYYPALALAVLMHHTGLAMDDLQVAWGRTLTLAAAPHNRLKQDLVIPIDHRGRMFIPYPQTLGKDFPQMGVHHFLTYYDTPHLRGNLRDMFEGNFVIISDIATGTSDLGYTPLEADVPLVVVHTATLNALLTRTFYRPWRIPAVVTLVAGLILGLALAAALHPSGLLYGSGVLLLLVLPLITGLELIQLRLFPLATVGLMVIAAFSSLLIYLEIATSKDRRFIKRTFGLYMPENLMNTLLEHPELLTLGGQEQQATVLFSDLAGFTATTEQLAPADLVDLLNEYFTEMTGIIISHDGIIDKFQGDGIMAEFGLPLPMTDHSDQAVAAALAMLQRLDELREKWRARNIPDLTCRIGINSGSMIVGNMGSHAVMDYTVMGNAVNLAARLEGTNKHYGTALIISEYTLERLTPEQFAFRMLDVVKVRGQQKPVKIYEVYGLKAPPDAEITAAERYYRLYDQAVHALLSRQLSSAGDLFRQALALRPNDPATALMLRRLARMEQDPVFPDGWDLSGSEGNYADLHGSV